MNIFEFQPVARLPVGAVRPQILGVPNDQYIFLQEIIVTRGASIHRPGLFTQN